jgi:hypothetical protein
MAKPPEPITLVLGPTGLSIARYDEPVEKRDVVLNSEQAEAVRVVLNDPPPPVTVITGEAGTGKSFVVDELRRDTETVSFTFEMFLCMKPWQDTGEKMAQCRAKSVIVLQRLRRIIIEEYGMVKNSNIKVLDTVLRRATRRNKPFGGFPVVFVGDDSQLPPPDNDRITNGTLLSSTDPVYIVLNTQMRQSVDADDDYQRDFCALLKEIRTKHPLSTRSALFFDNFITTDYYNARSKPQQYIGVCPTNSAVHANNWEKVISASTVSRYVIIVGKNKKDIAEESMLKDPDLAIPLHKRCRVQFTVNIYKSSSSSEQSASSLLVYNGQFGKFIGWETPPPIEKAVILCGKPFKQIFLSDLISEGIKAIVEINGARIFVSPRRIQTASKKWVSVFPFTCAYYTTVHRLQGQTISEKVHGDFRKLGRANTNLLYVFLTRVRHFRFITVEGVNSDVYEEWLAREA